MGEGRAGGWVGGGWGVGWVVVGWWLGGRGGGRGGGTSQAMGGGREASAEKRARADKASACALRARSPHSMYNLFVSHVGHMGVTWGSHGSRMGGRMGSPVH
eukprot:7380915-Prymnesium_polylepis.1